MPHRGPATLVRVERAIHRLRGHNVMLDVDLAALYGVPTKRFNEQVKRNLRRFPGDFMFHVTPQEFAHLRSQIATSSSAAHGGRRHLPYVFTEHGAVMAATILNSRRAVEMSIIVVRAFVRIRHLFQSNVHLARKIEALERKYDGKFEAVFEAIRELMAPPPARSGSASARDAVIYRTRASCPTTI